MEYKDKCFGYGVEIKQRCTENYRSPEQWGEWRESYENSLSDVARKGAEYPDVTSDFDIPIGEDAWVVWIEWSSGDSFGWGTNSYTEVMGIFRKQDWESADSLKEQIENYGEGKDYDFSYEFETPDGQKFKGCASWRGYFERLENVYIQRVYVVKG